MFTRGAVQPCLLCALLVFVHASDLATLPCRRTGCPSMQPGAEEEQEFNEAVYGQPLQLQQHLVQPTLPAASQPVHHEQHRRQHGHVPSAGPAGQIQPLNPGQEVPPVRAAGPPSLHVVFRHHSPGLHVLAR